MILKRKVCEKEVLDCSGKCLAIYYLSEAEDVIN